MNLNNVLMLTGTNYRAWLDSVENYMGMHENIDYCFTEDKPEELNEKSTKKDTDLYKKWHRSNRMAKNLIRTSMSKTVRGSIEEPELASDFLEHIGAKFKESEKAEAARLTKEFHDLKYMGSGGVREHIMKMININGRLRELLMGVRDEQVVHYALHSLPNSFSHLRTSYNSQKGNWTLDELISICVDEESRIKEEKEPATTINLIEKPKRKKPQNKLKPIKAITKSSTNKM
ncbi:uncharacterized protein LOC133714404 [Rosa rugosa]|uniref:uncharacterized protein LOC133714404 n=1 Tax=Rosa rugosa TaxID=74645 RepID=UPI002B4146BC|nr:uncharacterized protein LOC133714404 [Rosa rugosa]